MNSTHLSKIAAELELKAKSVQETIKLLDENATVPFIARYRKEVTGSLDEVQITAVRDRINQLRELDKRRDTILESIEKQGKLTDELKKKILAAETMNSLEDIYLPYKPKRRTRATIAKEKGLEPLAELIFKQEGKDFKKEAEKYIDPEKKVKNVADALAGARDIIAEWITENTEARAQIRKFYFEKGSFRTKLIKGKETHGRNYKDYFDWKEAIKSIPSHRLLAIRRAEKEEILSLRIDASEKEACDLLAEIFIKGEGDDSLEVRTAMEDSYKRLLCSSIETEIRLATKEIADKDAIAVFTQNLRQLLMAPPLGQHPVMAVDPAYRTGCKVVCLDAQGQLQHNTTIFPLGSAAQLAEAQGAIPELCNRFKVEFISIGNGTACRETESFIRSLDLPKHIQVLIIPEQGASVYSASAVARQEFPDHDVTVRGSVSIGRRLMDPLAELVKIDPKAIGVGQYQHDVDQRMLKQSLDDVVVSCVNLVGVELNSASHQLLTYVSGLGPARAQYIIDYRNKNGRFTSREDLYAVSGLGPKAIEQAAGFLRIQNGNNPLDASAVHPERYELVSQIAKNLKCHVRDLMTDAELRQKIDLEKYVSDTIGLPTLQDIYEELAKPGRDPRAQFEVFRFEEGVEKPEDLVLGMKLPGVVSNITNFGAFVDIGVHLDGLVHLSQLSDKFVKRPEDIVHMHQKVMVTVLQIDLERKRIALSMRSNPTLPTPK